MSHILKGQAMFDPNDESYKRAKRRVGEIKDFYTHLSVYGSVIFFLLMVDLLTGSGWWFFWPALAWGVGIMIHAAVTFLPFNTGDWEERKIRELMERDGVKLKKEVPADESYFERTSDV
jgi:hypothetical protein